jgi:hypothetical protein
MKEKLLSRKLWLAVIGAGAGIAIALGAPESIVSVIVGSATALVSVVIYIITEGKVDAAAVQLSAEFIESVLATISKFNEQKKDEVEK